MLTTRKCPKDPEQCVGGQVVASANNYDVVGMPPFQVLVGSGRFFPVWGLPLRGLDQAAYPVPPTGACRACTHPMRGSSPSSLSLFLKFCIFSLISCQVRIPLPRLPSEPATLSLLFFLSLASSGLGSRLGSRHSPSGPHSPGQRALHCLGTERKPRDLLGGGGMAFGI